MSQAGILSDITGPAANVETLTGDVGGPVGPNGAFNINLLTGAGLTSVGDPLTNTITFSVTGGGEDWQEKNGNFNAQVSYGYIVTNTATATLPIGNLGDSIIVSSDTTNPVTIQCGLGQYIRVGNKISALNGTVVSTAQGDSLTLVYRASTNTWMAYGAIGNWTIN